MPTSTQSSDLSARMAPHSLEAEEAVLGSVLIDPEALFRVLPFLSPGDFFLVKNQWVWEAILALHERRDPIDFLTVSEELERRGQLADVGGQAYLSHLINVVPTAIHAEGYGRIVEQTSIRRRLLATASDIAQLAYEEAQEIDEVIDRAEQALFGVSERRIARELVPISDVIRSYYARIEYLYEHRGEPLGVPTGFLDLDRLLGGLQRSDLIIIAARPGVGKTSFMLSIGLQAARRTHQRVAIFSLEMSNEQVVQRLISQETGIDSQRLRLGDLHEEEWPLFVQASSALSGTSLFIDDTPSISALQLRTKARRLHAEHGLDLIIVDYLQLMTGDMRSENRVQEIAYISRSLKGLARELNVPVLAASQLSRAVEQRSDKKPMLSDLRESGCLTGDTLVSLASGELCPISSLVGHQPEVVTLDNWQLATCTTRRVWQTGHQPVLRLTTRTGRIIRATPNHPFRVLNGWQPLEELKIGDRIALARSYPEPVLPKHWQTDKLVLLAHLIGDGCYAPRSPLHYTSASLANLEAVAQAAWSAFGIQAKWVQQENWHHLYLTANANKWHPNPLCQWLRELGIDGQRSHEKIIPGDVFALPTEQIAMFLRHLWATDGSIYLRKTTHGHAGTIYYSTTSLTLAQQVQHLLARAGILSRIAISRKGNYRPNYSVHVMGRDDQMRFAQVIGGFGDRDTALAKVVNFLESVEANTNTDTIPLEVWEQVKGRMKELGISHREMAAKRGTAYGGSAHFNFAPSRGVLSGYASLLNDPDLQELAHSDVYWDTIASIEPDGTEDVYDMTVPGSHNFVANGIIVHNSLEQDADVVMFIYRDDMYDETSERKNIAEIIVAKHRNGPTGSVELFFRSNLAQFLNAARREVAL